jgi:hypothetical protein
MRIAPWIAIAALFSGCDSGQEGSSATVKVAAMDQDHELIPFDPSQGIAFKYGTNYSNAAQEIAAFEKHHGITLPADFVRMIGNWCEGGFDGSYRVATGDFGRVVWWSMLLMKLPDEIARETQAESEAGPMIIEDLIAKHRANFTDESGKLILFPFGRAYCGTDESEVAGHLAFDLQDSMAILFIPLNGGPTRRIAATFEQMMHRAALEFHG